MQKWIAVLLAVPVLGAPLLAAAAVPATAAPAAAAKSPQGVAWADIARLPDWSGTWALTNKDHEQATRETRLMKLTARYQQQLADERSSGRPDESLGKCLPAGMPGLMMHTIGFEWLFTPGRVTMITENGEVRRIRTDGSPHLARAEIGATYEGDSIGHWEGATLVVDTIGFEQGMLLKNGGLLAGPDSHLLERITQTDRGLIQIETTLTDPAILTEPYKAVRHYERVEYRLPEPQCAQTSRYLGGSEEQLDLRPPPE